MNIDLYINKSDKRKVYKNLTQKGSTRAIQLLEPCSIEAPVVIVQMDENVLGSNYAYIAHFSRYYYITDKTIIEGNKCRLSLKCDVLKTYFSSCASSPVIAKRSTSKPDNRIEDPKVLKIKKPTIIYRKVGDGFTLSSSNNYMLTVSGRSV